VPFTVAPLEPDPKPLPMACLANLRALVVDDNATNRHILLHQLGAWNVLAEEVGDGPAALQLLRAAHERGAPYHFVLLDLQMPGLDGLALTREIRDDPALRGAHLVLLSSVTGRQGLGDPLKHGLDAHLTKPVREQRLLECLCTILGDNAKPALPSGFRKRRVLSEEFLSDTSFARRPKILLVEDNEVNQRVAARMLEKLGCSVDVAINGIQALEAVERTLYQLVFMDCQMPDMDGYECVGHLRKSASAAVRDVKVIALTANAMPGDEERCRAAGMDGYLAKPFRMNDLKQTLAAWLARSSG
jgi:CheY-like chemotaxis protein